MSVRTLPFQWWSQKLKFILLWVPTGQYLKMFVFLQLKPLFCQSAPTKPTKHVENVYLDVLQYPIKFQAEILTGKFLKKTKISTRWLSSFLGLFLTITPSLLGCQVNQGLPQTRTLTSILLSLNPKTWSETQYDQPTLLYP